jgi:multicomponent Na+:H+ antiporter subunit B
LKAIQILILAAFGALMMFGVAGLPNRFDVQAPPHRAESVAGTPIAATYYIENAYVDAATPNIVTAVLADYRSFDTLGEVIVVFTAGLACFLILRRRKEQ